MISKPARSDFAPQSLKMNKNNSILINNNSPIQKSRSERSRARRQEKANSLFGRMASSFFVKEKTGSIITVTRIVSSEELKSVKIFISIFPENKEKEVFGILKGKAGELRKYICSQIKMKFLPFFEIEIDEAPLEFLNQS